MWKTREAMRKKLFVQDQHENFWFLFYTKPRGEGDRSSLVFLHMTIPVCFSPTPKISVRVNTEFEGFGTQQVDITLLEEKKHISVSALHCLKKSNNYQSVLTVILKWD